MSPAGRPARPRRPLRRRLARALAALLLALVALAAALEIGARTLWTLPEGMEAFQQTGMYVVRGQSFGLRPGYRGTFALPGAEATSIEVDALGLRGAGLPPRVPGQLRVLCVGDSLVFGHGVQAWQALPARVEERLATALDRPVVAANGGVPGYGTLLAAGSLSRLVPATDPDAVVLGIYLGNDFVDDLQPSCVAGGMFFQGPLARLMQRSLRARLAVRSRFLLWFETWLFTNHPERSPLRELAAPEPLPELRGLPPPPQRHAGLFLDATDERRTFAQGGPAPVPLALDNVRSALRMARQSAGGRPLLVVVLPTLWHVQEDLWREHLRELGFDPAHFSFGAMRARLRALAAELGVPLVDVCPVLQGQQAGAMFLGDRGHLSPAGNEAAGRAIADALRPLVR